MLKKIINSLFISALILYSGGLVYAAAPSAPQNLRAAVLNNGTSNPTVELSWSAPSNNGGSPIQFYIVYRGTAPGGQNLNQGQCGTPNGSTLKCIDNTNVVPGSTYYYKVRAINQEGSGSPLSNEISVSINNSLNQGVNNPPNQSGTNSSSTNVDTTKAGSAVVKAVLESFGIPPAQLFTWAIGLGAILAFGVIVYGGVLWSVSMGGEQKNAAKEWIKGAIYGLLLLIAAYLILRTINPELVNF